MSEVEKTPDPVAEDEKPGDNEPISVSEADKEPEESESKASKDSGDKGTVLDMFKKFASSDGPSWADLMVEQAIQQETTQKQDKMDRINEALAEFKEPFIIFASNLSTEMTAEDVFFMFGGPDKVIDMFLYEGQKGEALVEFKDKDSLADALMKHEELYRKKKLNVEYVDACQNVCYTIPQPSGTTFKPPQSASSAQDRAPPNRNVNGGNRRNRPDRGPQSRGYDNRSYDNRPPPRNQQSNDVRMNRNPNQQIPSLFTSGQKGFPMPRQSEPRYEHQHDSRHNEQRFSESRQSEPKHFVQPRQPEPEQTESKSAESKVSRSNPFGQAKPVDTEGKMRQMEEKMATEGKKAPVIQKKQSVSSQHSQQLSEDHSVDEQKQPTPEAPKSVTETVAEPEKKPIRNITVVSSKHRQFQNQRLDHRDSHTRINPKINVQPITKFLGSSQKSLVNTGREDRKKRGDESDVKSTVSSGAYADRRFQKRPDYRKNSSASTKITGGHRDLQKQSSNEAKSPTRPPPISTSPVFTDPPVISTPAPDSAVGTTIETTPADPEVTTPAATKAKKSKNKKKKSSAGIMNSTKFGALNEIRE